MPTRAELKANAKQALTGKWGKGALITLCYILVVLGINIVIGVLSFIPFIGILITVVSIPLSLGVLYSFIKLKRGENVGAFDFLKLGFQNFKRAWCLTGRTLQKMLAPIIVMCVLMVILIIGGGVGFFSMMSHFGTSLKGASGQGSINTNTFKGSYNYSFGGSDYDFGYNFDDISYTTNPYARSSSSYSSNPYARDYSYDDYGMGPYSSGSSSTSIDTGSAVKGIGAAIGTVILFIVVGIAMWGVSIWATVKGLLYALTYYIAYDNPEMSAKDAVQRSEDLMRGNRGKLFVLQLSFIGWAILAVIPFGIGMFWLLPYMMITLVCFYEALAGGNNGNSYVAANSQNVNVMNNTNNNINMMNGANNMNNQYNPMAQNMNNTIPQDINQMQNINNTMPQDINNMSQAPEVTEYVPVNFEQNTNQTVGTEPTVNQSTPVTPVPDASQYNPVTPTPDINQYNPNQFNPINNDFNNPNNNNI